MNLVVFDLDGTLTDTSVVDNQCFIQALHSALNIERINTNWSEYRHITDSGVMAAAFKANYGRDPEPAEVSRFIECFFSLLTEALGMNSVCEIPGAGAFLNHLRRRSEWHVAIATGGWECSARFKMTAAGLNADSIPAAFAEHGPARETIAETAISKACAEYQINFEKIVLVGDAVWDVRTAQRLGFPFVGVGSGQRAASLLNAGAKAVIENFLDCEQCVKCFEDAVVPKLDGESVSGN
jgi:phosphoglycolate phosphatase-like HAD superfamily hydrolase